MSPHRPSLGRRRFHRAALCALLVAALPVRAFRLDGIEFADRITLAGQPLLLNGAGFRAVAMFKGYAAALYVAERAGDPATLIAAPGPKRLQMRMLLDVPAAEFVKAFRKGVARNTPAAEAAALADRMAQFEALMDGVGSLRKGDVVDLDFVPGSGLRFSLNGRFRGSPLAGADFYAALLRIFLGERPVDRELKRGLLGDHGPR